MLVFCFCFVCGVFFCGGFFLFGLSFKKMFRGKVKEMVKGKGVLVLDELIFLLVVGTMFCFGFRVRTMLIIH